MATTMVARQGRKKQHGDYRGTLIDVLHRGDCEFFSMHGDSAGRYGTVL